MNEYYYSALKYFKTLMALKNVKWSRLSSFILLAIFTTVSYRFSPCVLKAKVTSLYDLRLKVFVYTHCQHESHFLPPWAQSVWVTHQQKTPQWGKPNNNDPCGAQTHSNNWNRGLLWFYIILANKNRPLPCWMLNVVTSKLYWNTRLGLY